MPRRTGIINRKEYLQRLFKEDAKIAGKDKEYGDYLNALSSLLDITNDIYEKQGGKLDKKSHEDLVKQYLEVTEKAIAYRDNGKSPVRGNVVDYIQKVVSKDLKVLNSLDKENPGMLDDAFEASRTVKVEVPSDLTNRVGGQMSDRFPMKSKDGTKGYFTARKDTAQEKEWNEFFKKIEAVGLDNDQMEKINKLRNNHKLRVDLQYEMTSKKPQIIMQNVLITLGICRNESQAKDILKTDDKLKKAMQIFVEDGPRVLFPYNLQDRLGYDPYTRNDNKNAAMYEVAKLLGCEKIIAKAVPMVVVNGKQVIKGTFMEQAEGNDLSNLKSGDYLWFYDYKESPYNKDLFRDLADMQLLDYICGNIDRHKGNMLYKTKHSGKGKIEITGIVGIDNDASFPEKEIDEIEFNRGNNVTSANIFKPSNFRYVNKKTAEIVKNMTRGQLETILRGQNLSKKAIDLAWKRTKEVQKAIGKNMKKNGITYVDDISDNLNKDTKNPDNPFNLSHYHMKPSIFAGFDTYMGIQVSGELTKAGLEQAQRFRDAKNHVAAANADMGNLDKQELAKHLDAIQAEKDSKFAEYRGTTRESAFLAEGIKIDGMNALMNNINRLKSPTKEFGKMRDAMFILSAKYKEISSKIVDNQPVEEVDYTKYKECMDALNAATKNYIQLKGLTPKSEKGRNRLAAATSIENRVEELLSNFESDKKLGSVKVMDTEILPESEHNEDIEMK